jgi:hypothetical protein
MILTSPMTNDRSPVHIFQSSIVCYLASLKANGYYRASDNIAPCNVANLEPIVRFLFDLYSGIGTRLGGGARLLVLARSSHKFNRFTNSLLSNCFVGCRYLLLLHL